MKKDLNRKMHLHGEVITQICIIGWIIQISGWAFVPSPLR